jgi:exopolysaccharide biosynthesis polyprenyl glycosylphosphotransferase
MGNGTRLAGGEHLGHRLTPRRRTARAGALLRTAFAIADAPARRVAADRDALYRRSLAAADILAAALAGLICVPVLGDDGLALGGLAALPLVVLAGKVIGLYERDELVLRKTTLEEAPKLFQLATLYTLLLWLLEGPLIDGRLGDHQVLGLWSCLFLFSLLGRAAARKAVAGIAPVERCLFVGDATTYDQMAAKLTEDPAIHATLIGRVPFDDEPDELSGPSVLGDVEQLAAIIAAEDVHRVILPPGAADTGSMLDIIRTVKGRGVKVTLLPRVFEVVGSSVEFDDIGGVTVLGIRRFGLPRSSQCLKRATDVVGAAAGLVFASPLLAAIAVAIKIDSRGPVFFRQTRVGKDGRRFSMLKFRTMRVGADQLKSGLAHRNEADGLFKIADDPRITRVGSFLRRTSLDELPQIWNVLRGEMSLVGPRPLVVDEDERIQGWHRRRLHLTPGMTGHWQILGSSRVPLREMVKIDYLYVANWSLWSDAKIMLRTVPYVLKRRGL